MVAKATTRHDPIGDLGPRQYELWYGRAKVLAQ